MNAADRIGRKTVHLLSGAVDTAVMIAIMLLIAVGCYAIWDSNKVYHAADAAHYEIYKPTAVNEGKTLDELRAINPDVFGWITVYGTNIDYPLVQSENNMTYVNADAEGRYSLAGSIFLDSHSSRDFSDFNSMIHGHNMEKQAMFGEIGNFHENDYFDERRYGTLYYDGQEHGMEFFAFLHTDAYDGAIYRFNISERESKEAYLELIRSMEINSRDVRVTADDRIVLLSTCSEMTTNGRDLLVAKLTDNIPGDPFITEEPVKTFHAPRVDEIPDMLSHVPYWAWIVTAAAPALLILLLIITKRNKKRYGGKHAYETRGMR